MKHAQSGDLETFEGFPIFLRYHMVMVSVAKGDIIFWCFWNVCSWWVPLESGETFCWKLASFRKIPIQTFVLGPLKDSLFQQVGLKCQAPAIPILTWQLSNKLSPTLEKYSKYKIFRNFQKVLPKNLGQNWLLGHPRPHLDTLVGHSRILRQDGNATLLQIFGWEDSKGYINIATLQQFFGGNQKCQTVLNSFQELMCWHVLTIPPLV